MRHVYGKVGKFAPKKPYRVEFDADGGTSHQKEDAMKKLQLGLVYIVEYLEVSGGSTLIKLKGIEGLFNSVMFADIPVPFNENEVVQLPI